MINQRVLPNKQNTDLVTTTIQVNGKKLPLEFKRLYSMTVSREVNKIPFARLVLEDGDVASQKWELSDQSYFVPGNEIEILAGYHSDEDTIFKGIVLRHSIKVRRNRPSILVIECKSPVVRMTIGRHSQYFDRETDADAIEDILKKYQLKNEIKDKTSFPKKTAIVQHRVTDWDFMVSKAEVNGLLTFVEDNKVVLAKPDLNQQPKLRLQYGAGVYEFEAGLDSENQYESVATRSWNFSDQLVVEDEAQSLPFREQGNVSSSDLSKVIGLDTYTMEHSGHVSQQELLAWANAKMIRSKLSKICGRIKIEGLSGIQPGDLVNLQGFGNRFNGNAFVSRVHHELDTSRWFTHLQFGLSHKFFTAKYEDIEEPTSSCLLYTSPSPRD